MHLCTCHSHTNLEMLLTGVESRGDGIYTQAPAAHFYSPLICDVGCRVMVCVRISPEYNLQKRHFWERVKTDGTISSRESQRIKKLRKSKHSFANTEIKCLAPTLILFFPKQIEPQQGAAGCKFLIPGNNVCNFRYHACARGVNEP